MKTLFVLASVMVVLFLAAPNKIEAQTPKNASRLEARVAELEKRLAAVEAQLARIAGTTSRGARAQPGNSRDNGSRFMGNWKSIGSGDYVSISKDGDKYIVRDLYAGVHACELSNGSLKCGMLNVDFIESSGHITWRGMEMQRLPQTTP